MIPKPGASPAAIRNSITPSWRPFSACSRTRRRFMRGTVFAMNGPERPFRREEVNRRRRMASGLSSLHRAFLGVGILVVGEHRFLDLHHRILAGGPRDRLQEVEVLDREVVGVLAEPAASGSEVRL